MITKDYIKGMRMFHVAEYLLLIGYFFEVAMISISVFGTGGILSTNESVYAREAVISGNLRNVFLAFTAGYTLFTLIGFIIRAEGFRQAGDDVPALKKAYKINLLLVAELLMIGMIHSMHLDQVTGIDFNSFIHVAVAATKLLLGMQLRKALMYSARSYEQHDLEINAGNVMNTIIGVDVFKIILYVSSSIASVMTFKDSYSMSGILVLAAIVLGMINAVICIDLLNNFKRTLEKAEHEDEFGYER